MIQKELIEAMVKNEKISIHNAKIIKLQIGPIVYVGMEQKHGTAIFGYEILF